MSALIAEELATSRGYIAHTREVDKSLATMSIAERLAAQASGMLAAYRGWTEVGEPVR